MKNEKNAWRKCASEVTIDSLRLSKAAKKDAEKKGDIYLIVSDARIWFNYPIEKVPIWEKSLIKAVDRAGLIRRELYPTTYNIAQLMKTLSRDCEFSPERDCKLYESAEPVSIWQYHDFMSALKQILNKIEYMVVISYYGFDTGKHMNYDEIAKYMDLSRDFVRAYMKAATEKLSSALYQGTLPKLPTIRSGN